MFIHILLFHIFLSPIFQCLSFWCSTHQPHLCSWAHRCSNFGPFCFQTKWMTRCTSQSSSNWQDFPPPLFFKTSPQVRLYYSHHFQLALHPEMFIHNPQLGLFLPPYWLCGTSSYDHRCKLGQGSGTSTVSDMDMWAMSTMDSCILPAPSGPACAQSQRYQCHLMMALMLGLPDFMTWCVLLDTSYSRAQCQARSCFSEGV